MRSSVKKVERDRDQEREAANAALHRHSASCTGRTTTSGTRSHPPPRRRKSPHHRLPDDKRISESHSPTRSPTRRPRSPPAREVAQERPVRTYSPTAAIRLRLQAMALGPPEPRTPSSPTSQWRAAAALAVPKDSGSKPRDRSPPARDRRLGGMVKFRQHHRGQERH